MPPLTPRLLGAARSTLLADVLKAEAPIGWSAAVGKRCCFNTTTRRTQSTKTPATKRWTAGNQKPGLFAGIRFASGWRRADIATSPKRSDAKPLLGALFGASALAFFGSSLIAKEEDGEAAITIHAHETLSVDDAEGESILRTGRCLSAL